MVNSGAGVFTLSGNNTYTGSTLVNSGQLLVNGSISSDVTLSAGASLGGSGNVGNIGGAGQTYTGGFFTDTAEDFYAVIQNAPFNYYVQNNQGAFSYNGVNYSLINSNFTVEISTAAQTANFFDGTVNGQVLQLQIIPEANSFLLVAIALVLFTLPQAKRYRKSRFPV